MASMTAADRVLPRRPSAFLLAAASACALAFVAGSPARAGEPGPGPLDQAERMEKEAHALLEQGHRVEGARLMSKVWAIRAEAFAHEQRAPEKGTGEGGGDLQELRVRIEHLRAKSGAEEKAAHEAKEAGREEEAREHMAAAERLWKEAAELEAKAKHAQAERAGKHGPAPERAEEIAKVKARIEELRAASAKAEEEGHRLKAEGRMDAAEAAIAKAGALWKEAEALKAKAMGHHRATEEAARAKGADHDAARKSAMADIERLRAEVAELRQALQEIRALLERRDR